MLSRVILVLEILTIIIGMYRVYGKKIRLNILNSVTFILMLFMLELVNFHDVPNFLSNINFILIFTFCFMEFKDSFSNTIISYVLGLSIISIIQFICIVLSGIIPVIEAEVRNLLAGIMSVLIAIILLPHLKLQKLRESILKTHWLKLVIVVFVVSVFMLMLAQGKVLKGISINSYIFVVPAIIIILLLVLFWDKSISEEKQLRNEIDTVLAMQENYEGLITKVQANQHDFKNHLLALISTHYTYKSYDQLVDAQKEYYKIMEDDARYNDLLKIGNRTLGGFLYGKMLEIESKGVTLQYNISTEIKTIDMPYYYLIEILGIIIDNAIDASLENSGESIIYIGIEPCVAGYIFKIRNTYKVVGYDEILNWFKLGQTTKKHGRGIGLYQANKLCEEWNCDLMCDNLNIDNRNWILFQIEVKRKEDE